MTRSSLLYWFPRIEALGIPVPLTRSVRCDPFKAIEGGPETDRIASEIVAIVKNLKMRYPLFLRTDHTAGKHDYLRTCYVSDEECIAWSIVALADDNFCKDILFDAIVVREFLDLDSRFRAFNGLPIGPERRYFVDDGEILCHHPYWPEDTIEFYSGTPEPADWRHKLAVANTETDAEIALLSTHALRVAAVMDGAWSVDFALTRSGIWYLIDMAEACVSWHPSSTCSRFGGET
jgi:hypothetical protein